MQAPTLSCDAECQYAKRMQGFAEACGVSEANGPRDSVAVFSSSKTGTRVVYSQALWVEAQRHPGDVRAAEQKLGDFLVSSGTQALMLPVMAKEKRQLFADLAVYWDLECRAVDQEPARTLILTKKTSSRRPTPTLLDFSKERRHTLPDGSGSSLVEPDELARDFLDRAPECGLLFKGLPGDADAECVRVLRPFVGKFIGITLGHNFCCVFFDERDMQGAVGHLRRIAYPHSYLNFLDHVRAGQPQELSRRAKAEAASTAAHEQQQARLVHARLQAQSRQPVRQTAAPVKPSRTAWQDLGEDEA